MLKRGWGVLFLWLVAFGMALATGRELMFTLAYLLAALLLISLVLTWSNLHWIEVIRDTRTRRSQVGKPAVEDFTVINRGWLPKLWLEVRDHSTLPNHRAGRVIAALGAHQRRIWNVRTTCIRRGRFTLGPLTLRSADPFGLFSFTRRFPDTSSIIVYPATVDIPYFQLPFGDLPGGDAMRRRTHYITDNVCGVRDYVYGDSFNRIHWRSTARTGRLISKEFELDPATDIWLYLDMDMGVHVAPLWLREEFAPPLISWLEQRKLELLPTTEEYTVTVAASLARHLVFQGRAIGLVAYGRTREVIQPDRGTRQLNRLLETLAVLEAKGSLPFVRILMAEGERLPRGTTIVAITPAADLDWIRGARDLGRRGVRLVAVLIRANSFAPAPDQAAAIAELRASMIPTFVISRDDNIGTALATPLGGSFPSTRFKVPSYA